MKYLILGKKITSQGVKRLLKKNNIDFDVLDTEEVNIEFIKQYDLVIKSPGIKYDLELIKEIEKNDIEIISDIELVYRMYNKNIIGITGTNGKTSVTTYINDILNYKYKSVACGNIGTSISEVIDEKDYDYYVCELSSFMLENIKQFRPNIAIFLNLTKAHLDYHNSFKNYIMAKTKFLFNLRKDDIFIYNQDDELLLDLQEKINVKKYSFSIKNKNSDCYYDQKNKNIYYKNKKLFKYKNKNISIIIENILPTIIVAQLLEIPIKYIKQYFIKDIKNIDYRIQKIKRNIYNDSKSTNPVSTTKALEKLNKNNILLLCGGQIRNEDYRVILKYENNIKKIIGYGESKNLIKKFCEKNHLDYIIFDTLEQAILHIRIIKKLNDILLFSPMHASLDQYKDYKDRGFNFNHLIKKYL